MPSLRFISGSGTGSNVAQGVVGQIGSLNVSISTLNTLLNNLNTMVDNNTTSTIKFYLNGNLVTIANPDPTLSLVDYLRYHTNYKGTKKMCNQGGCGTCAVMISYYDSADGVLRNVSINSCLRLLVNCDGLAITTVEGIGGRRRAALVAHPVQERIAKTYGLQCGACTAGIVMSQYTALQPNTFLQSASVQNLEKNFDGNICRCSCFHGITKMARSFLPEFQIKDGSNNILGYNLSGTGPVASLTAGPAITIAQGQIDTFMTGAVNYLTAIDPLAQFKTRLTSPTYGQLNLEYNSINNVLKGYIAQSGPSLGNYTGALLALSGAFEYKYAQVNAATGLGTQVSSLLQQLVIPTVKANFDGLVSMNAASSGAVQQMYTDYNNQTGAMWDYYQNGPFLAYSGVFNNLSQANYDTALATLIAYSASNAGTGPYSVGVFRKAIVETYNIFATGSIGQYMYLGMGNAYSTAASAATPIFFGTNLVNTTGTIDNWNSGAQVTKTNLAAITNLTNAKSIIYTATIDTLKQLNQGLSDMGCASQTGCFLVNAQLTAGTGTLVPLINNAINKSFTYVDYKHKFQVGTYIKSIVISVIGTLITSGVFFLSSIGQSIINNNVRILSDSLQVSLNGIVDNTTSTMDTAASYYGSTSTPTTYTNEMGVTDQTKAFTVYNPANDVNASAYSSFLQTYSIAPAKFYAPAPYSFTYYRYTGLSDVITTMQAVGLADCELVGGATSYGIPGFARDDAKKAYLDINNIPELDVVTLNGDGSYTFGANVSLNKMARKLQDSSDAKFNRISKHIQHVAGHHVRNAGSWVGGFVMTKKGFDGDLATLLIAAKATLSVVYVYPVSTTSTTISCRDFINTDLSDRYVIIKSVTIPASVSGEFFDTYRLAIRQVNAKSYINTAMSFTVNGSNVITDSMIVYGALTGKVPQVATNAMTFLSGKTLTANVSDLNTIMTGALAAISAQVSVNPDPTYSSTDYPTLNTSYRNDAIKSLFYMMFMKLLVNKGLSTNITSSVSGIENWVEDERKQNLFFEYLYNQVPDFKIYPLHYAIPKLNSLEIALGIAKYQDDYPITSDCLFASQALSTVPNGQVNWVGANTVASLSKARATPGVEKVITAQDLPGLGITNSNAAGNQVREILGDVRIFHYGFPIALVIANTERLAQKVAKEIIFDYLNVNYSFPKTLEQAYTQNYYWTGTQNPFASPFNLFPAVAAPFSFGDGGKELDTRVFSYNTGSYLNNLATGGVWSSTGPYPGLPYWIDTNGVLGTTGAQYIRSTYEIETKSHTQGQNHFTIEKNSCHAYKDDNGQWTIVWSSQSSSNNVFPIFGLNATSGRQIIPRYIGGGFGGKLTFVSANIAVPSLLASWAVDGRMVRYNPTIDEEYQAINAGSHETLFVSRLGFESNGKINHFVDKTFVADGHPNAAWGYLPEVAGLFCGEVMGNDVLFPSVYGGVKEARTVPMPRGPKSSKRGAGHPEAAYQHAVKIDTVAAVLNKTYTEVDYINLNYTGTLSQIPNYVQGNPYFGYLSTGIPQCFNKLLTDPKYDYTNKLAAVNSFNSANKYRKRGIIISQNQYDGSKYFQLANDTWIKVRHDGYVQVHTAGVDCGQGINPKVAQVLSKALKVPLDYIIILPYDSKFAMQFTKSSGSSSTQALMYAMQVVCNKALDYMSVRLGTNANGDTIIIDPTTGLPVYDASNIEYNLTLDLLQNSPRSWLKLVSYFTPFGGSGLLGGGNRKPMTSANWMSSSNYPNFYNSLTELLFQASSFDSNCYLDKVLIPWACMAQVEIDVLTGNKKILEVDLCYDVGEAHNRGWDATQLEGGIIFSIGQLFSEVEGYNDQGQKLNTNTWTYKPPCSLDLPEKCVVEFVTNNPAYNDRDNKNTQSVFGGKPVQEMGALAAMSSLYGAVAAAVRAARADNGLSPVFTLDLPMTPDKIKAACGTLSYSF